MMNMIKDAEPSEILNIALSEVRVESTGQGLRRALGESCHGALSGCPCCAVSVADTLTGRESGGVPLSRWDPGLEVLSRHGVVGYSVERDNNQPLWKIPCPVIPKDCYVLAPVHRNPYTPLALTMETGRMFA